MASHVNNVVASFDAPNPFDVYRKHIGECLAPIVGVPAEEISSKLQWTQTFDKGDLMLPVPALRIKGKPADQATEWASKFPESELVEKPVATGTFLPFFFKPAPLTQAVIPAILKHREQYGTNAHLGLKDPKDPSKGRQRIIVEFSSPNIAKPFHAGHLRSTIIGGFLANLHEAAGYEVIRMNYLGDWGRQFGLLANAFELFGDEEKLKQDPIGHLFDIYVEINRISGPEEDAIKAKKAEIEEGKKAGKEVAELEKEVAEMEAKSTNEKARQFFKRLEDGDPQARAIWKRFRDLSIEKYKQTYARLNIRYDYYSGESQVQKHYMDDAAKRLRETGVSSESEGAVVVDLTKDPKTKKLGKALVQKRDGSSLYLTRDIGEAVKRHEVYKFDKMIYVVASQQDLHLAQLFKILELMGHDDISRKCVHVNFGMVLGMSTRKGTVKFLDDILRDVGEHMHEVMKKNDSKYQQVEDPVQTADTLGITAVMVQDMSGKRVNNYEFSLERMTSFEGDTGPYLQYAHARLCSITRKAAIPPAELLTADLGLLTADAATPHALNLVRALASWPDVLQNALKTLEPVTVLAYLFKMTHMLSSSYDVLRVVGSEREVMKARMALYESARVVLNSGMRVLGLNPVERYVFPRTFYFPPDDVAN
jgi:arginyl-tRNA synthetase